MLLSLVRMWNKVFPNEGLRGFLYLLSFVIRSPQFSPDDTCRQDRRSEHRLVGNARATRHLRRVYRVTWTESSRSFQEASPSPMTQSQTIHLTFEISAQYSNCLSNHGIVCRAGIHFPLKDFCPDRLEVLWSILELKGLYPFWLTFVARREKGHS